MPNRRNKKNTIAGNGIIDTAKKIYEGVTSANKHLKANKYAARALKAFPVLGEVPYIGTALRVAREHGYGKKKGIRIKGSGMNTNWMAAYTQPTPFGIAPYARGMIV